MRGRDNVDFAAVVVDVAVDPPPLNLEGRPMGVGVEYISESYYPFTLRYLIAFLDLYLKRKKMKRWWGVKEGRK